MFIEMNHQNQTAVAAIQQRILQYSSNSHLRIMYLCGRSTTIVRLFTFFILNCGIQSDKNILQHVKLMNSCYWIPIQFYPAQPLHSFFTSCWCRCSSQASKQLRLVQARSKNFWGSSASCGCITRTTKTQRSWRRLEVKFNPVNPTQKIIVCKGYNMKLKWAKHS